MLEPKYLTWQDDDGIHVEVENGASDYVVWQIDGDTMTVQFDQNERPF